MPSNKTQHTPGPWEVYDTGTELSIFYEDGTEDGADIAYTVTRTRKVRGHIRRNTPATKEDWANARLMAAAPDLLQAARCALADLEGVMSEYEPSGDRQHPGWKTIEELNAAISKASNPQHIWDTCSKEVIKSLGGDPDANPPRTELSAEEIYNSKQ